MKKGIIYNYGIGYDLTIPELNLSATPRGGHLWDFDDIPKKPFGKASEIDIPDDIAAILMECKTAQKKLEAIEPRLISTIHGS